MLNRIRDITSLLVFICRHAFDLLAGGIVNRWQDLLKRYRRAKWFPHVSFKGNAWAQYGCRFGEHVVIHHGCILKHCTVDNYSYISHDCKLKYVQIGKFCSIGPNVKIGIGKHPARAFVSTHPAFYATHNSAEVSFVSSDTFQEYAATHIGNDVWIGRDAIIMDGVNIGDGAIIGAKALVTKDVPPYAIVGGVPAKLIRYRFPDEQISFLLKLAWWNKDINWIQKHERLFQNIETLMKHFQSPEEAFGNHE